MFFVLSKILDVLLSPYSWGLALLAMAVPWRGPQTHSWRRKRLLGVAGLAVLLFFSIEPVSNRIAYWLEHTTTSTYRPAEVYDTVILLGGMGDERVYMETGEPALSDPVERLTTTARLLREGRARTVIVSGAPENAELANFSEARMLGTQLAAWGIDPSRIILEEQARNTHENALYADRIVKERGFEKVLMVTSAYHMRRARECFNAVGMQVDTLAVDYRAHSSKSPGGDSWLPRTNFLSESVKMLREALGLYIYRLQGYAKPLG